MECSDVALDSGSVDEVAASLAFATAGATGVPCRGEPLTLAEHPPGQRSSTVPPVNWSNASASEKGGHSERGASSGTRRLEPGRGMALWQAFLGFTAGAQ
jgi:hypothetical protein